MRYAVTGAAGFIGSHLGEALQSAGHEVGGCDSFTLAQGLGVGNAVTFLGAQPREVVIEEMQRARAFVQHSVVAADGNSEGTHNAILEASASGLPVVATRHAGIPEVVVEGKPASS